MRMAPEASLPSQPRLELVRVLDVEDTLAGHFRAHRDRGGEFVELEVRYGVGVGGEDDCATRFDGEVGEVGIEVLAPRETVDLDRHPGLCAGRKDNFPASLESRTMMEVATTGVGENMHLGRADGAQETLGLISVRVEMAVNGGDHAVDLETFALGNIEGAVGQDLDLEPLEETVVLAVLAVPAFDSPALKTDPFPVEPRCDLEAA